MSSTVDVRQWFRGAAGDLSRHARDFGITFVGDDGDVLLKEECVSPTLPPMPSLIPLSELPGGGGGDRVNGGAGFGGGDVYDFAEDSDQFSGVSEGYGGIFVVNGGEGCAEKDDEDKLLRLFGGGDSDTNSVAGSVSECNAGGGVLGDGPLPKDDEDEVGRACGRDVALCFGANSGASRCSVVLDPLPTELLRSLTQEGRISAQEAARSCHHSESNYDSEIHGLLDEMVSAVEGEGEEETSFAARRRASPPSRDLEDEEEEDEDGRIDADEESRDCSLAGAEEGEASRRKSRHRKSDNPRKLRRRRDTRSSSSSCKKRRKRSTSCSTTSSNGSNLSKHHKHHHKHRHRRKSRADTPVGPTLTPRVNPIFVWVKQEGTRIAEVLCEDYDKRNRIRITKTPNGWRAIPRTEMLASTSAVVAVPAAGSQQRAAQTVPAGSSGGDGSEECRSAEPPGGGEEREDGEPIDGSTEDVNCPNNELLVYENIDLANRTDEDESPYLDTKDKKDLRRDLETVAAETPLDVYDFVDDEIEHSSKFLSHDHQVCDDDCELQEVQTLENECDNSTVESDKADSSETRASEEGTCVREASVMEVDSEPTDLSLPKKRRAEDDSVLIPKKIIARSLSLALPAIPSPQPKPSPQPSDRQINNLLPAHQQKPLSKSVFLESLLSSPKKCHQTPVVHSSANNVQPLNLGAQVNRNVRSPTVSCSEDKKPFARSSEESQEQPKAKCQKVEDITLKNLLSRKPKLSLKPPRHTVSSVSEVKPTIKKQELDQFSEATRKEKSRLLELLTSEPASVTTTTSLTHDLDPLAQLKTVLSDPNITVPDPLLVPRDRLQELVASPGREIPRLLTVRPELRLPDILAYPSLLQDPDLLVVSLQHLQKILQKTGNSFNEAEAMANSTLGAFLEWQWYQHQQMAAASEIMDSQRKHQERKSAELLANDMDAATTAALNQMLWLSHLEAAAALASRDNNSDFLSMLNAMLPKTLSPPASRQHTFGPGFVSPSPPGVPRSADYKNQLEFQQTLALWQKVMSQPNSPGALSPSNRHLKTNPAANNHVKNLTNNKLSNGEKMNSSSARTSPISPNVHQHRPTGNNGVCARSGEFLQVPQPFPYNHHRQQHQPPPVGQNHSPVPTKPPKSEFPPINASTKSAVTCKSLLNLLSNQRRQHGHKLQQEPVEPPHGTLLSALGKPPVNAQGNPASSPVPRLLPIPQGGGGGTPMDLSGSYDTMHSSPVSKLKVKKYLVDPNNKPRLLKAELAPALVSPTGAVRMEDLPLQTAALWHPLFGSKKSPYNSQWQWTTVTANGE